jgi:hypothetical protein
MGLRRKINAIENPLKISLFIQRKHISIHA